MLRTVLSLAACASVAVAGNVPVLMWSPNSRFDRIEETTYTTPFSAVQQQLEDVATQSQALVLFLQDQFSHFDFSRFSGAGGESFQQLQDALDQSMSKVLPAVERAGEQIEATMSRLAEEVKEIADSGDVEELDLGRGRQLFIVRLPSPAKTGKPGQFAVNDALVGQVSKKVAELTNNNYVAVWAAEKPSEGCKMSFAPMTASRNRRQAATEKNFGDYQDRYFSQRSITVIFCMLIFVVFLAIGTFVLMEMQTPLRFQDPSIPLVGKE